MQNTLPQIIKPVASIHKRCGAKPPVGEAGSNSRSAPYASRLEQSRRPYRDKRCHRTASNAGWPRPGAARGRQSQRPLIILGSQVRVLTLTSLLSGFQPKHQTTGPSAHSKAESEYRVGDLKVEDFTAPLLWSARMPSSTNSGMPAASQ